MEDQPFSVNDLEETEKIPEELMTQHPIQKRN